MRFFNSNKDEHIKKPKGRQGRSKEVRRRKELERQGWYQGQKYFYSPDLPKCRVCGETRNFVEDHSSGDLICESCGAVSEEVGGLGFLSNCFTHSPFVSKPYQKVVHFRQRISQLLCRDPEQEYEHMVMIRKYIIDNHLQMGNPSFYGIKTFSFICRKLGLNPKIASHWMQIRKRLGIAPFCDPLPSQELIHRITMRYICIAHCFDKKLKRTKGESNPLKRNNVINLNYSIIQLIRMESEEEYHRLAKFFPQLISHNQPALNNKRWEIILEECRTKYKNFSEPLRGEPFTFDWEFKPILVEDLVKYFYFFY